MKRGLLIKGKIKRGIVITTLSALTVTSCSFGCHEMISLFDNAYMNGFKDGVEQQKYLDELEKNTNPRR